MDKEKIIDDDFLIMKDYVETPLGKCYLITLGEYKEFSKYQFLLSLQKFQILRDFKKQIKVLQDNERQKFLAVYEELKNISYIDLIKANVMDLYNLHSQLFFICFRDNVFNTINTDEELTFYLDLIAEINAIDMIKENPNPEIEKFKKLERDLKSKNTPKIKFKHIYTSVWAYLGGQRPPLDMTLYAFFNLFDQISMFKNYDTTSLFRSVGADIKDNVFWCGDIERQSEMDEKEFEKKSNSFFSK